jgi:hypothetical protein
VPSPDETIASIEEASTWDDRIARIRLIPSRHGTDEHQAIFSALARDLYVPHLGPDFAYVNVSDFYELSTFQEAYRDLDHMTESFRNVSIPHIAEVLRENPRTLLPLRVLTGLIRNEFAEASKIVATSLGLDSLSAAKVDSMERGGGLVSENQAVVAATTIWKLVDQSLFGEPPGDLRSKQNKPDTRDGWASAEAYARDGVPFDVFLHQRHYGGAFRQLLDATSTLRGNIIEDAVQSLFEDSGLSFIRTGSHNQGEIEARFEVLVRPAPDFVVFDKAERLQAMLECKGANDGGTARDKALRFARLRDESVRLGGIPLFAVLGGLGWLRVNDTLGPVIRDCDGRVFSVSNIEEMLAVSPFPQLLK